MGEEGLSGAGMGGGMDAEDLFSQLFGGAFGGAQRGPRRGKDMVHHLKVKLEDLYNGKATKLAVQKNVICPSCEGRGGKEGAVHECTACKGVGYTVSMRQMGPMVQQVQQPCASCKGRGEIINEKDKCQQCQGNKVVRERKILELHIDKGMRNGQRITFAGEGDQMPKVEPGDIVIVLDQVPHEHFQRKGDDLVYDAQIDLLTALAGGRFAIPHLDDRVLVIDIAAGDVIRPGMVKQIPGEGMPTYRHHNKGTLLVKFQVDFPSSYWAEPTTIEKLNTVLPPRPELPSFGQDKHIESAAMQDADVQHIENERARHGYTNAMDEDDEMGEGAGPGVQCAQQ